MRTIKDRKDFNILVIDKDKDYCNSIKSFLSQKGYLVSCCDALQDANNKLADYNYDLVISDIYIWLDDYSIKDFLNNNLSIELVILAKKALYSEAGMAVSNGAKAYLDYYSDMKDLAVEVERIRISKNSCSRLKEGLMKNYLLETKSKVFKKMLRICEKVSKSNTNILLVGESGVGKEVIARYIHTCSNRCRRTFVPVNCSAFSETLLESELFGHEKGAYTGARDLRKGRFEIANHGTLFLDEVGDVSLSTQVKLLRAIESKSIERIGSNILRFIDFRLITASNKDLKDEVIKGNFREDFFYRISTIVVRVPPLRERREDLDSLINFILEKSSNENRIKITGMDKEVREFLYQYDYPGNIRELKNIIDRMVVLSEKGIITKDGLPVMFSVKKKDAQMNSTDYSEVIALKEFRKRTEAKYIKWILGVTGGNVAEAARRLNVSSRHLFNKINEYKIRD